MIPIFIKTLEKTIKYPNNGMFIAIVKPIEIVWTYDWFMTAAFIENLNDKRLIDVQIISPFTEDSYYTESYQL